MPISGCHSAFYMEPAVPSAAVTGRQYLMESIAREMKRIRGKGGKEFEETQS